MAAAIDAPPARVGKLPASLALAAAGGGLGLWAWAHGMPTVTADLEWRVRAIEPGAVMVDRVTVMPLDLRLDGQPG